VKRPDPADAGEEVPAPLTVDACETVAQKRAFIKRMMKTAWDGYHEHAWVRPAPSSQYRLMHSFWQTPLPLSSVFSPCFRFEKLPTTHNALTPTRSHPRAHTHALTLTHSHPRAPRLSLRTLLMYDFSVKRFKLFSPSISPFTFTDFLLHTTHSHMCYSYEHARQ
jgi:hypothetical protein